MLHVEKIRGGGEIFHNAVEPASKGIAYSPYVSLGEIMEELRK